jgi:4-methyl-5(b-hydroxyethyl)-thiazole monophosphate biosynthesis
MEKKVLVPVADGTEELEAITITNVLRRAGADVTVASVNKFQVTCSRGIKLIVDRTIGSCMNESYDLIALPGGMPGAEKLRDSEELTAMLKRQQQEGRLYAAICSAPAVVFKPHGLLDGRQATCNPGFVHELEIKDSIENTVVVDGNCITSRGAGTAIEFALKLVELLYDKEKVREVAGSMVFNNI